MALTVRYWGARGHRSGPVNIQLTHLHLDHIQGLMFFAPLFDPEAEVHIYGPAALDAPLLTRLGRYISAPLAPVEPRELPAEVTFEEAGQASWRMGPRGDRGGVREPSRPDAGLPDHRR